MTAGLLLAGGRSTRMGVDKAALDWHGRPLVLHVLGSLRASCDPVLVVTAGAQKLPALPAGVLVARDARPGRGPLEGLAAGLGALHGRAERAFVSSVDAPFLTARFIEAVAGALGEHDAAVPYVDGRAHVLAACYRLSVRAAVEAMLEEGELRVSALLERCDARLLTAAELPDLRPLRNLNTRADYEAALRDAAPDQP